MCRRAAAPPRPPRARYDTALSRLQAFLKMIFLRGAAARAASSPRVTPLADKHHALSSLPAPVAWGRRHRRAGCRLSPEQMREAAAASATRVAFDTLPMTTWLIPLERPAAAPPPEMRRRRHDGHVSAMSPRPRLCSWPPHARDGARMVFLQSRRPPRAMSG